MPPQPVAPGGVALRFLDIGWRCSLHVARMIVVIVVAVWLFAEYPNIHVTKLGGAAIGVGVAIALFLSRLFFSDWEDFWTGFWHSAQKRGDPDERWCGFKFIIWSLLAAGGGALAYHQLPGWFPHWFQ